MITAAVALITGIVSSISTMYVGIDGNSVLEQSLTTQQTEQLINQLAENYQFENQQRKACEAALNPFKKKVADLENKVDLLVNQGVAIPFPHWLKGLDGTMLALNEPYENVFLKSRGLTKEDYIGKKDRAIWPESYASKFRAVDLTVQSTGGVWVGEEWVIVNDSAQRWQIIKYQAKVGGNVVGIGGIAIPPKNSIYFPIIGDPKLEPPVEIPGKS